MLNAFNDQQTQAIIFDVVKSTMTRSMGSPTKGSPMRANGGSSSKAAEIRAGLERIKISDAVRALYSGNEEIAASNWKKLQADIVREISVCYRRNEFILPVVEKIEKRSDESTTTPVPAVVRNLKPQPGPATFLQQVKDTPGYLKGAAAFIFTGFIQYGLNRGYFNNTSSYSSTFNTLCYVVEAVLMAFTIQNAINHKSNPQNTQPAIQNRDDVKRAVKQEQKTPRGTGLEIPDEEIEDNGVEEDVDQKVLAIEHVAKSVIEALATENGLELNPMTNGQSAPEDMFRNGLHH